MVFSPEVGKVLVDCVVSWLRPGGGDPLVNDHLDWVLMQFAQLFGLAKDEQRPMKVTDLGGHAIEARLRFVAQLEAVTKRFHWGPARTRDLAMMMHRDASDHEIMEHFQIDVDTLGKGKKKIEKSIVKLQKKFVDVGVGI
jgi:hypothetical protein